MGTTKTKRGARAPVVRSPGTKLAEVVADRIVLDIAQLGRPEGEVLGSEPELLERYGVSRAVFREAVRLLEHLQVVRMRRGPGGGLVVTAPTLEAVVDPVAIYLFSANTEVAHVAEVRIALEESVAELATARLTARDAHALQDLAERERAGTTDDHRELHSMLASITRNPAIELFVELLNRLTFLSFPDLTRIRRETIAATHEAHLAIIEAVLARDAARTRRRMRAHLQAEADYLRRRRGSTKLLDVDVLRVLGDDSKRAEYVAREILVAVAGRGWPVGELLGSEAELMDRYDVSRAVLREAVRVLEYHQVAAMRRGPGGGLFVTRPGVESVTGALALMLEWRGIDGAHLLEVRTAIEVAIVGLAVQHLGAESAGALRAAVDAEMQAADEAIAVVGHDVHAQLAGMIGNPVFELLSLATIRLTRIHQRPASGAGPLRRSDVHRAHAAIVEAICDDDAELAARRMRRHLRAMRAWVQ